MDEDNQNLQTDQEPLPASEPPPWAAELGDLRSNVDALKVEAAKQANEAAYWRGVASANTTAAAPPPEGDIPDASFHAAIENGDTAELVRLNKRQTEITARRMVQQLRTDTIDPMIDQFQNVGLGILSSHTRTLSASKMPYYTIPEIKTVTDEILSKLTPQQRASEEGVIYAYQQACGMHTNSIIEFDRKSRERDTLSGLSDGGGRVSQNRGRNLQSSHVPQPEDLGGDDARRAADAKGGGDILAIKLGYKNWNDYMHKTGMVEGASS